MVNARCENISGAAAMASSSAITATTSGSNSLRGTRGIAGGDFVRTAGMNPAARDWEFVLGGTATPPFGIGRFDEFAPGGPAGVATIKKHHR